MLIRRDDLERIRAGEVSVAFRRWERPTVRTGGTLRTAIGVLAIGEVALTTLDAITESDALAAGYRDLAALRDRLERRDGDLYRISLAYLGPDPRIALRESDPSETGLVDIEQRFARFDRGSRGGPWTLATLTTIERHPRHLAADLAASIGQERAAFKRNVRKLKELGLTESHRPGYTLSPRGVAVLAHLRRTTGSD